MSASIVLTSAQAQKDVKGFDFDKKKDLKSVSDEDDGDDTDIITLVSSSGKQYKLTRKQISLSATIKNKLWSLKMGTDKKEDTLVVPLLMSDYVLGIYVDYLKTHNGVDTISPDMPLRKDTFTACVKYLKEDELTRVTKKMEEESKARADYDFKLCNDIYDGKSISVEEALNVIKRDFACPYNIAELDLNTYNKTAAKPNLNIYKYEAVMMGAYYLELNSFLNFMSAKLAELVRGKKDNEVRFFTDPFNKDPKPVPYVEKTGYKLHPTKCNMKGKDNDENCKCCDKGYDKKVEALSKKSDLVKKSSNDSKDCKTDVKDCKNDSKSAKRKK